ncbi:MAG: hypothetical protein JHD16_15130 [Solirubrobacteraceae bacterium]|nr:hypothetical protein [Solirubrobacteraceae bacterium]
MRHEADRDTLSAVARVAGALVGLALVLVAVAPWRGVPPQPGSGALAPAQIEVRVLAAGEFEVDPIGTVLEPTVFPAPGERGGPTLAVTVRNITGVPLRVSLRLIGLPPTLDRAVKVRGSVAGAVIVNGPLGAAGEWSRPAGLLRSGQQSTLRMRFKLLEGLPPEAWRGKLDVRQLEFRAVKLDGTPAADAQTTQSTTAETPPAQTSPAPATTPAVGPPMPTTSQPTTPPASTPTTP